MKKPLIGVTTELALGARSDRPSRLLQVPQQYAWALTQAGAVPVYVPLAIEETEGLAAELIARLDGLILSGGDDVPAELLAEPLHPKAKPLARESWESEVRWMEAFVAAGKPVLGVCLGMQLMTVHGGGGLIQDIPDQCPSCTPHAQKEGVAFHSVRIEPDTRLSAVAPAIEVEIASSHHQAARDVPPGFKAAAYAPDGLLEAIEREGEAFCIGVQWHPEHSKTQPDWLLQAFVEACRGAWDCALSEAAG